MGKQKIKQVHCATGLPEPGFLAGTGTGAEIFTRLRLLLYSTLNILFIVFTGPKYDYDEYDNDDYDNDDYDNDDYENDDYDNDDNDNDDGDCV